MAWCDLFRTQQNLLKFTGLALLLLALGACSKKDAEISSKTSAQALEEFRNFRSQVPAKNKVILAAADGDVKKLEALFAQNGDLNENAGNATDKITPVLAAVVFNHADALEFLLSHFANCRVTYKRITALQMADFLSESQDTTALRAVLFNHSEECGQ